MYGRRSWFGGWFGGPATRRLETGTRDAKTDVWMIWLQALSSVVILSMDFILLYTWLLITSHEVIRIGGYLLFIAVSFPAAWITARVVRFGHGLLCRYVLRRHDLMDLWELFAAVAAITVVAGSIMLVVWDIAEWHWWRDTVRREFPGRTLTLLQYVFYSGFCLAVWVGLATAWLRWWAKEIPDPVRPETEMGGRTSLSKAATEKTLGEIMLDGDLAARETRRQLYAILRHQFEDSEDSWAYPVEVGEPGLIQTQ
jgi:hypothetical protein